MLPERNPDTLPDSSDPSGPCPRCGRVSNFNQEGTHWLILGEFDRSHAQVGRQPLEQVKTLYCQGCGDGTVVIERRPDTSSQFSGVFWWPLPGVGVSDPSVPTAVAETFDEGVRCLAANAPNGAAAMLRAALAQIVQDRGSAEAKKKGQLKASIKQMVADGDLWPAFGEWADHIREMGNAGAHPEAYGAVSKDEASDLQRLVRQLIEILYIQPAQIAKARAGRGRV